MIVRLSTGWYNANHMVSCEPDPSAAPPAGDIIFRGELRRRFVGADFERFAAFLDQICGARTEEIQAGGGEAPGRCVSDHLAPISDPSGGPGPAPARPA